jgi:hypothetical protein
LKYANAPMMNFVATLAVVLAVAFPLVLAAVAVWNRRASSLSPLVRVCAVLTLVAISFAILVEGVIEDPGAQIHASNSDKLVFLVGAVAITLAVLLVGAGLAALSQRGTTSRAQRVRQGGFAIVWLLVVYLWFIVGAVDSGFDVCLPPSSQVGGTCEISPG